MTLLLASSAAVAVLRELPYSTSLILSADESPDVMASDGFDLGPLSWRLTDYTTAPSLEAFRSAFAAACGKKDGLDAAQCVLGIIKLHSSNGTPSREFLDARFDPAAVLGAHLNGEPGHCTSRSFMTATALLAMGKPARVVQLLPPDFDGHNVIEVWTAEYGWAVFDPHYESTLLTDGTPLSAERIAAGPRNLRWERARPDAPDAARFAGSTVSFPEPWLYTRVGVKVAPWPFRGLFVRRGPRHFLFGPAQKLALALALVFAGSAFGTCAWWLSRRRQLLAPGNAYDGAYDAGAVIQTAGEAELSKARTRAT